MYWQFIIKVSYQTGKTNDKVLFRKTVLKIFQNKTFVQKLFHTVKKEVLTLMCNQGRNGMTPTV